MKFLSATPAITSAFVMSVAGHATLYPNVALPGSTYHGAAVLGHGCNSQVISITLNINDGVTSVKPEDNSKWTITTTTRALNPPSIREDGTPLNTTINEVFWNGSFFDADNRVEHFRFSAKLPGGMSDGSALHSPMYQVCANGEFYNWSSIPPNNEGEPATKLSIRQTEHLACSHPLPMRLDLPKLASLQSLHGLRM
ncbi:hypothetical protein HDV00_000058 [Rhizophlyctis rosea]|nr:hypothetical protein HDV00_000058 [Rhizophlyctis rosea]